MTACNQQVNYFKISILHNYLNIDTQSIQLLLLLLFNDKERFRDYKQIYTNVY